MSSGVSGHSALATPSLERANPLSLIESPPTIMSVLGTKERFFVLGELASPPKDEEEGCPAFGKTPRVDVEED